MASPISKPPDEIMPAISMEDAAENTGCQVTTRSQHLNLKSNAHLPNPGKPISLSSLKSQITPKKFPSNTEAITKIPIPNPMKIDTHPPNTEKPTSLSSSNSIRIEKPTQGNLERSPPITASNSKNLIPYPMESKSHKYPSIQVNPDPHNLGEVETLPVPKDSSEKSKETKIENLNKEYLVEDIEMELPQDCSEDSSGHIKTSLRSWKQLLRNSNPKPIPIDNEKPIFQTHIKRTNSNSSSDEYPRPKKLAIERLVGGTLPPCQPP